MNKILHCSLIALMTVALHAPSVNSAVAGAEDSEDMGSEAWNAMRAQIFSQVCMGSAPSFADVDAKAEAAGLSKHENGWHMPPEVLIDVLDHDNFCSCFMTMRAPEPEDAIEAIHGRLMQDFGASFTGPDDGLANVAPFDIDGQEVVSLLEPRVFNGDLWVAARLSVVGNCQKEDVDNDQ